MNTLKELFLFVNDHKNNYDAFSEQLAPARNLTQNFCEQYWQADAKLKRDLEDTFAKNNDAAWFVGFSYPRYLIKCHDGLKAEDWIRLSLIAASVAYYQVDCRDCWVTIGMIHKAAEAEGVDPRSTFKLVAGQANDAVFHEMQGSAKGAIGDFYQSGHFKSASYQKSKTGSLDELWPTKKVSTNQATNKSD